MFEECATTKLRSVDANGDEDEDRPSIITEAQVLNAANVHSGHTSEPSTPRLAAPDHVDKSNSCIYSSGSLIYIENKRPNASLKEFRGWDVCERPHSAGCTGYQKSTIDETRESGRKQPKSANYRAISPRGFPNTLRGVRHNSNHHHRNMCRYTAGAGRKSGRDRMGDGGSASSSSASSVVVSTGSGNVAKKFKHYRHNSSYMEQYREEYTYRKLIDSFPINRPVSVDALICSCGSASCPGSLTSSACIPRWFPNQSQQVQTINLSVTPEASENSNVSVQQQRGQHHPVIKKREASHANIKSCDLYKYSMSPNVMASVKLDEKRPEHVLWAKEGVLRMEFYPTSLTVNSYNPMKTNSGPLKGLPGSPTPLVNVSRSRPSIPSNSRGSVCPPSAGSSPIPQGYGQTHKSMPITRQI